MSKPKKQDRKTEKNKTPFSSGEPKSGGNSFSKVTGFAVAWAQQMMEAPSHRIHPAKSAHSHIQQPSASQPMHHDLHTQTCTFPLPVLFEMADCLWDIERKIRPESDSQPSMKQKIAHRQAKRALKKLEEIGLKLEDHTNQPWLPGMGNVIDHHLQPTENIEREIIIETIRPSIYLKNEKIRKGEVWVATKKASAPESAQPAPEATEHALDLTQPQTETLEKAPGSAEPEANETRPDQPQAAQNPPVNQTPSDPPASDEKK